ncbi:GNAT family N-acetyltransferase [Microbacterium natoriense]|uniref:GNAT family N-acetyltransferase n=1 Tax=Microbacterium TaxID=33882 RepID=UPI00280B8DEC|nr:GNAT family N-acetyltransferase [Microbacterium sp. MYb72]
MAGMGANWTFRPSLAADAPWMAEVRAETMRPDLERLGVFDEKRVRTRFLDAFAPAHTRVIVVDAQDAGLVAVRPDGDELWIEHFYLSPHHQGQGIGGQVLRRIVARAGDRAGDLRLDVLRGSAAQRLYERHGFVLYSEDGVDLFLRYSPQ